MTDRGDAHDLPAPSDLASRTLRGSVVAASDGFFARKENLVRPELPGAGESRRPPGVGADVHEWVVVRLAARAAIGAVEVDTSGYTSDAPSAVSLTRRDGKSGWSVLLEGTPLRPDTPHRFRLPEPVTATHVRLNVFPGGGIARLRLFGTLTDGGPGVI